MERITNRINVVLDIQYSTYFRIEYGKSIYLSIFSLPIIIIIIILILFIMVNAICSDYCSFLGLYVISLGMQRFTMVEMVVITYKQVRTVVERKTFTY